MNFESNARRAGPVFWLALCALWTGSARAASPPAGQNKDLEEMSLEELMDVRVSPFTVSSNLDLGYRASNSVSGSRFDAPTRDLPFAIQAFTETFIADQKPVNIFDVARYSPGVTYRSNDFNEGNANLAIRGFAISSTPGNIQSLRDGFHGPSIFDFTNIDRVEVVKGPASFLYGQVAPGGIVNVITKNPQPQFAARAQVRVGSYGEYRVEPDITGPIEKGLYYRLAASYDQDMHYWDPYDAHSLDIAPSLLAQPSKRLSMSLKYEHFQKIESPQVMQKPGRDTQAGVVPTRADPNLSGWKCRACRTIGTAWPTPIFGTATRTASARGSICRPTTTGICARPTPTKITRSTRCSAATWAWPTTARFCRAAACGVRSTATAVVRSKAKRSASIDSAE